jgi:hypothetical protein
MDPLHQNMEHFAADLAMRDRVLVGVFGHRLLSLVGYAVLAVDAERPEDQVRVRILEDIHD